MSGQMLAECSFLIPLRRDANLSDGETHDPELWESLEAELFSRFGGATIAPGQFTGFYRDPDTGEQVHDLSTKYVVAIPAEQIGELRMLLSVVCLAFKQKCIYLSIAGQVEFVEPSKI